MNDAPHPTDAARAATEETSRTPDAVRIGTADASGMPTTSEPAGAQPDPPDPADEVLVDQAGRPLGPRALKTRRKILEATTALLGEKPMREMRVIDIARRIGSSPATFYQYFKDVEDVVLYLAGQAKEATPILVAIIDGDWEGPAGLERGKQLANLVIDHWEKYAPVLRARNNASDEGHPALREERMAAMMPLVDAFQRAIERSQAKQADSQEGADGGAFTGGRVDAFAGATALASVLERTSMYHQFVEETGSSRDSLVETTAVILQGILTSRT
ncbi:MAG: TetR/AcrR family transcriptional regulator [bacterium]|nr:TetR/AcrR family transcriptional regulator [bacterium]